MPRHRRDLSDDHHPVACPFCGEPLDLYIEPDVGGTLVQDCEVCCNPWQVTVTRDRYGDPDIRIDRLQD